MLRKTVLSLLATTAALAQSNQTDFFEKEIRPLLVSRCGGCHGDKMQMAGLKLTTAEGFARGADTGPIVDKDNPANSRLLNAISYEGKIKMPPTGKLEEHEISALRTWVTRGAPWPGAQSGGTAPAVPPSGQPKWDPKRTAHWAFQPMRSPTPPPVHDRQWVRTPVDQFILASLEKGGLKPSRPADKMKLLRRAKLDLHGLMPSEDEIREFTADTSPDAFAKLVDRLLASPRYGEQWGRHWLDVARYADSAGRDADAAFDEAWRYRDYVIDAFNRDEPYDLFVREQVAGDLMPAGKAGELNIRGIVATGFLSLGPRAISQTDKKRQLYDTIDEQIDATSRAFMGLTIACARCHDHKFDPISTRDYYSLAGIFGSIRHYESIGTMMSKLYVRPLVSDEEYRRYTDHQSRIGGKQSEIDLLLVPPAARYVADELRPRLPEYMQAARRVYKDSAKLEETAAAAGLDKKILKKWVAYLKPNDEFRNYLDRWYQATDSELPARAEAYGKVYDDAAKMYYDRLVRWERDVPLALQKGTPLPAKPNFGPLELTKPEDRFFLEIAFQDGPFDVPAAQREKLLSPDARQRLAALRKELKDLKDSAPSKPPMAHAAADGKIVDQPVFLRGSYDNPGEVVPRQFPVILAGERQRPVHGSGRLDLAEWLTGADHPLTARVMVNRIWQWHFGEGIVRTSDNFGLTGEAPSHPELLDWLARQFVSGGWSIKAMHRLLMNSSAYQMSAASTPEAMTGDPDNRFLSHFNPRRLTVEEMRDSILALDGSLDLTMGGRIGDAHKGNSYEKTLSIDPDRERRRSIYLPLLRNKLPSTMNLFDFADTNATTARRNESNIAPQALYLMNSDFANERARAFAEFLLKDAGNDRARIERANRIVLARNATRQEVDEGLQYLTRHPATRAAKPDSRLEAWQSLCHVLILSNEFHYVD